MLVLHKEFNIESTINIESNTDTNTNTGENLAQFPQQCWFNRHHHGVTDVGDKQKKYNVNTDT